jgi:hypothetical protein
MRTKEQILKEQLGVPEVYVGFICNTDRMLNNLQFADDTTVCFQLRNIIIINVDIHVKSLIMEEMKKI